MDSTLLQVLLALAMFITTAVSGIASTFIIGLLSAKNGEHSKKGARWLSLLSCFSGGVFLATCFLDIIPHIAESYNSFLEKSANGWEFPVPYMFICIGFFVVYLIEEACMKIFSMGHGHSHGGIIEHEHKVVPDTLRTQVMEESVKYMTSKTEQTSFLKSITFAIAMSFHSVLEGFALGVQDSTTGILTLFVSLILHKAVEAFSVGLQVSKGNTDRKKVVLTTIIVYALMTPVGSILGAILQNSSIEETHKLFAVVLLESCAAGTFIYVTFLEVLAREKENEHNSLYQLLSIFIGFLIITALQFFTAGHGHGHDSGSSANLAPHNHTH